MKFSGGVGTGLRGQLRLNTMVVASFMLVILSLGWYASHETGESYVELLSGPLQMRDYSRRVAQIMLQSRRDEKDFLLRHDEKYAKNVLEDVQKAIDTINTLKKLDEDNGHTDDVERMDKIIALFNTYQEAFDKVVEGWKSKGLSEDDGLQGKFNIAVREVINILQNYDTDEIRIHLAEMRNHEKNFLLQGHEASAAAFAKSYAAFSKGLGGSTIIQFEREKVAAAAARYKTDFETIVAQRKTDPEAANTDKINEMNRNAAVVEDILRPYSISHIMADLLTVRKHEKDYLLTNNNRYAKRLTKTVEAMLARIAKADNAIPSDREKLKELLEGYLGDFQALVTQESEIASQMESMRSAVHEIEAFLADTVRIAEEEASAALTQIKAENKRRQLISSLVGLAAILLVAWFNLGIGRRVLRQVGGEPSILEQEADEVAAGDLTIAIPGESGIAAAMRAMVTSLQGAVKNGTLQAETVAAIVSQLREARVGLDTDTIALLGKMEEVLREHDHMDSTIYKMRDNLQMVEENAERTQSETRRLSQRLDSINSSAEEASTNLSAVAISSRAANNNLQEVRNAAERTGHDVDSVAAAVEEMTANLDEVRRACTVANDEATHATKSAKETAKVMKNLRQAAHEIGEVVLVIKKITDHTNLLALNAAIEAAGAGEAGRGFAVVANEVKDLASKTKAAAETINQQVQAIQDSTLEAGKAVGNIQTVVDRLASSNDLILTAVSEQSQALGEVAVSISHVSMEMQDVVSRVNAATDDISSVDNNVQQVSKMVTDMTRYVAEGASTAIDVSTQATDTQKVVIHLGEEAASVFRAAADVQAFTLSAQEMLSFLQGTVLHVGRLVEVLFQVSGTLSSAQEQFKIGDPLFDIQTVKGLHLAWLGRLEQVLRGRLAITPEEISSEQGCDFGAWYNDEGHTLFGEAPIFLEVGRLHEQVHQLAREVVAIRNGELRMTADGQLETVPESAGRTPDYATADKRMANFTQLRTQLFNALDALYLNTHNRKQEKKPAQVQEQAQAQEQV